MLLVSETFWNQGSTVYNDLYFYILQRKGRLIHCDVFFLSSGIIVFWYATQDIKNVTGPNRTYLL